MWGERGGGILWLLDSQAELKSSVLFGCSFLFRCSWLIQVGFRSSDATHPKRSFLSVLTPKIAIN